MPLVVLVDYDNVDEVIKRKGMLYLIESILSKINNNEVDNKNLLIRLYGGWYEKNSLTRKAQLIQSDVSGTFPKVMIMSDQKTSLIVNVELAYSIVAKPKEHLFHTFRRRSYTRGLIYNKPQNLCKNQSCELSIVYNFFNSGNCSQCNTIKVGDMFAKHEQKLVDTMLTVDLVDLAIIGNNILVVSSDDDLWPGILSALTKGVQVVQMHTKGRNTNNYYLTTANNNYSQRNII
ncbi:MAG: hypothetical protein H3C54_07420 [Taibaiella sp.]|nr:hypothetical protein [Taibaiella sp.]